MKNDKLRYANSFQVQSENTDPFNGKTLVEPIQTEFMLYESTPGALNKTGNG